MTNIYIFSLIIILLCFMFSNNKSLKNYIPKEDIIDKVNSQIQIENFPIYEYNTNKKNNINPIRNNNNNLYNNIFPHNNTNIGGNGNDGMYLDPPNTAPSGKEGRDFEKWYNNYSNKGKYYNTVEKNYKVKDNTQLYKGRKIKDIYNELTKDRYKNTAKKCKMGTHIDAFSHKPVFYNIIGENTFTIKEDKWAYNNECVMNGGSFDGELYGYDPSENLSLAV